MSKPSKKRTSEEEDGNRECMMCLVPIVAGHLCLVCFLEPINEEDCQDPQLRRWFNQPCEVCYLLGYEERL